MSARPLDRLSASTIIVVIGLVAALGAFALSEYRLFQLSLVLVYSLAILGLALVTGYNGQISVGHGAFYALGAYVSAALMADGGVPYWATIPVAGLSCLVLGFLLGFPALRLGGLYLALTTFALAVAVPQLLKYDGLERWTGGSQGILTSKPDAPFGLPLSPDQWLYVFTLAITAIAFILAANLVDSRIGLALRAIRDQPLAAEAMGMDLVALKTRVFAISAMLTGIAGSLGAILIGFVSPDSFPAFLSITLFVGLLFGGAASLVGPVFGGLFITFVPNLSEEISKAAPNAIYGGILILAMFVAPNGIAGIIRAGLRRLAGRRSRAAAQTATG